MDEIVFYDDGSGAKSCLYTRLDMHAMGLAFPRLTKDSLTKA